MLKNLALVGALIIVTSSISFADEAVNYGESSSSPAVDAAPAIANDQPAAEVSPQKTTDFVTQDANSNNVT